MSIKVDHIDILCPYNPNTMDVRLFGTTSTNDDEVLNSVFPVDRKYKTDIKVSFNKRAFNQRNGELKVSVNSHLLGRNYPDKISIDNIEDCLKTVLSKTNPDLFDPKELIEKGYTNHVHATEDIKMEISKDDCRAIHSLLIQPSKWHLQDRQHNSFGWKSKLAGDMGKQMFKMYNKGVQMNGKQQRRQFMSTNGIPADTFDGILRLELKLQSPELIRRMYETDNQVLSVLKSTTNPIISFIEKTFNLSDEQQRWHSAEKLADVEKLALMEKHHNDWDQIEQIIRRLKGTNASKVIKQYRSLYQTFVESPNVRSGGVVLLNTMVNMIEDGGYSYAA